MFKFHDTTNIPNRTERKLYREYFFITILFFFVQIEAFISEQTKIHVFIAVIIIFTRENIDTNVAQQRVGMHYTNFSSTKWLLCLRSTRDLIRLPYVNSKINKFIYILLNVCAFSSFITVAAVALLRRLSFSFTFPLHDIILSSFRFITDRCPLLQPYTTWSIR